MPEGTLQRWLVRGWYGTSRNAWLRPLTILFAATTALRRQAYRKGLFAMEHPGVPVIVVGNLAVGGAGKTPLVIWLAGQLKSQGINVGVVLRGHGGRTRAPQCVTCASDPVEVGDEAVLIARRTGCLVAIGRDRPAAARLLVEQGCTVLLSDDGLQHLALARDLEIVVIDGARGLGNGALLPQGPLREPPARLGSVDAVVIHGADASGIGAGLAEPLSMTLAVDALRRVASDEMVPLDMLRSAEVHAVAGIGNPARFFAQLATLGCRPREHVFADHHPYAAADLAFEGQLPIVMTEKDAVKCRAFAADRMYYLQVSACLPPADAARLLRLAQGCIFSGSKSDD
jgi:tetraacyldisaccharide 4'-kinase